jgi:tetratricopeptide (TPR) repeat protein
MQLVLLPHCCLGDRAGEGGAYWNLGCVYISMGDYAKAIGYHAQLLAIAKEVGDRAGEDRAYGNLGNAYYSHGDFSKAIWYLAQLLAIAKEVGDREWWWCLKKCLHTGTSLWEGRHSKSASYGHVSLGERRARMEALVSLKEI